MNQPQPNPIRRELARGEWAEPHPDEDVLTAFAEHSLADRERGEVMEHLSHCVECREVLSFAAVAVPEEVRQKNLRALPVRPAMRVWLPWVAVAAGAAVVSSAVVIHERAARIPAERENTAVTVAKATPPPPLIPQPAQAQQAEIATYGKQDRRSPAAAPQPPVNAAKKLASPGAEPMAGMEQETYSNLPVAAADQVERQATVATGASVSAMHGASMQAAAPPPPIPPEAQPTSETALAQKVAPKPSASAAAAPAFSGLIGGTGLLARSTARAQWRINAQGQAERSVGYGPWQAVLPEEKTRMRVVSVNGAAVWLGGESLRLYHSEDNGATWHMVQLPAKGNGEHSIMHIRFEGAEIGTAEADDGTQWNTVDGGAAWK